MGKNTNHHLFDTTLSFSLSNSHVAIAVLILMAGLLGAVTIVFADDISTSVTVGNAAPTISSLSFNGGSNLTLTENTFVNASTTMTITDTNGCSEISSVTAQFAFSSTTGEADGTTCTYDSETCYQQETCVATTTGDTCDGGADTAVEYDCGFQVWYPARPTDASSPGLSAALWYVTATTSDGTDNGTATNTAETIDVVTLDALNVTGSIGYGSVSANSDTGATNQSAIATSTGNTALDTDVSGDVMCKDDYPTCSSDSFAESQQKFDLDDVTYASLSNTLAATSSPATIQFNLATSSSTTSPSTNTATTTYWGIAIPAGQAAGSYTGQNTFTATSDI